MNDVDDFLADDLFEERKKHKKRKADGKKKGNRTELGLVKVFNKRFGGGFSRSVGSGNRWGQVAHLPKHAQEVFSGDLTVPQGFKWALESKGGYADLDLNSVFVAGSKELDGFLDQVMMDSQRCAGASRCWVLRSYLEKTGDFSLVKWFHDQGVPQVIQSEEEFYAHRL